MIRNCIPVRVFRFYIEGFRSMTLGRTLWWIIFIKLFIMFVLLKLLFFPSFLQGSDEAKGEHVSQELIERIAL